MIQRPFKRGWNNRQFFKATRPRRINLDGNNPPGQELNLHINAQDPYCATSLLLPLPKKMSLLSSTGTPSELCIDLKHLKIPSEFLYAREEFYENKHIYCIARYHFIFCITCDWSDIVHV